MKTRIKQISTSDNDLLALLFNQAGEGRNLDPSPRFFQDPNNILLIAYAGETPAGFLYAYVLAGLKTPYPKMFLYSIDVFQNFQRQGIATLLICELKRIALSRNCSEIFVMTNRSNQAAMELYRKTGGQAENGDDILFVYDRLVFESP